MKQSVTKRESQILSMRDQGSTAKEVARELGISPETVTKTQVRVAEKFGLSCARLNVVLTAVRPYLIHTLISVLLFGGMPTSDDRNNIRTNRRPARTVRLQRASNPLWTGLAA